MKVITHGDNGPRDSDEVVQRAGISYQALVERVPAVVYVDDLNGDGFAVYVSPRIRDLVGYSPEEWVSDRGLWTGRVHPEDRGRVVAEADRARRGGEPALKRLVMETGERAPLTRGQTATGDLVNARKAVTDTAPSISNMSPSGTTSNDSPAVRATIVDLQGTLTDDGATKLSGKGAVQLFVDGNRRFDFTYDGRSGALVLADGPTKEGRHAVKVTATDAQDATASESCSFRIN